MIIPLGLITYLSYSYFTTGNFFLPMNILSSFVRNKPNILNIPVVLYNNVSNFFSLPIHTYFASKIDTGFSVVFLIMIFIMIKNKFRASYIIYAFLVILFPLSSGITASLTRYYIISFPHFILLAQSGDKNKFFHYFILIFFTFLCMLFSLRFTHWYWVG